MPEVGEVLIIFMIKRPYQVWKGAGGVTKESSWRFEEILQRTSLIQKERLAQEQKNRRGDGKYKAGRRIIIMSYMGYLSEKLKRN